MWPASAAGIEEAPGKRHADRFGDRGHGGSRAHGHAGAVAAGDAGLDIDPVLVGDFAGAPLVPVFPGIRARAQRLALPVAAQHRARGQIDRGQIHAGGAEQQRRRGLVAAAHQHHAVDGMAAQQFLGVHRQQVAVEHGGRLQERFRQRQRRQFHRKAAGHQDAALDVIDPRLEMHVAGLRVRPGVEDRDDRAVLPLLRRVAHLHGARAMAEGAEIVGRKPARAAKRFRSFSCSVMAHLLRDPIRSSHRPSIRCKLRLALIWPLKSAKCYERLEGRKFRNFSRNRPETTNLNHQYVFRRVVICPSSIAGSGLNHAME